MQVPKGQRYTQQYPSCLRTGSADSRRTTLLLGLGSKREYRYDSVGRTTTQIEYNAAGQRIYTMVDSYDAVGNRIGRSTNGNPTTWLYDDAYHLIGQEKSGQRATFAYDNNSNLTTKWHQGSNPQTMVYDAADRLTTMQNGGTTGTMSWFSRGAMRNQYETGVIKATYGYTDINNNLRIAQDAAGLTTSTYDGDNLRRKVVSGSVTTTFVWDGADYLQIKPSSGDATLLVVLEGEVVGHVKGSEKRDYIVDPLGSVVAYLNSSQALTDQFEYWPYGEMVAEVEAGTEPFLWVGSLGYFRDSDLRTYIRAREYRQDLGSWMHLDPLWPNQPSFTYCRLDPTSLTDPSGLLVPLIIVVVVGVVVLTGASGCKRPGPRPRPRPKPSDFSDCLRECVHAGGSRETAKCMAKCLSKKGRDDLLGDMVCQVYPGICEPYGGRPPCDNVTDVASCQDCCAQNFYVCMATAIPPGLKCKLKSDECHQRCNREVFR